MARFGAPFGSVLRSQMPGESKDEAMWEVPGSRWAAVTDDAGAEGLWVATEAKYGFRARNGTLDVTLLRSPVHTGAPGESHHWMYPDAMRGAYPKAGHIDLGVHHIRLALGAFYPLAPREEQPAALAESLFAEPVAYSGAPVTGPLLALEGGESLVPAWAKPADEGAGWVLRLHETLGREGETRVRLAAGWTCERVNALEQVIGGETLNGTVRFGAYDLVSLRLRPAG